MAVLKMWLCIILVLCSFVAISEQRSLPSSFESRTTKSDFTLDADGIVIGFKHKATENIKHKLNRLSPSGPDPKHH
ncbi:hypothetical protein PHAVU_003G057900 [Phaseolus vulgaris]|uniref:Uncharacterized protein n=1 Tax=Phaseolus vulgaris TaxID=3885 RepID=V7C6G1_PHAVU|nr:hypothetical protein PHAVU_003G057900g [Phaseolus vulgaris]ESW25699.1 hypothetical protein PHAVU_003G057900g [Phaseolus vulgaris]